MRQLRIACAQYYVLRHVRAGLLSHNYLDVNPRQNAETILAEGLNDQIAARLERSVQSDDHPRESLSS